MLVPLNFAGRSKPLPYNASAQFLLLDKLEFIGLFEDGICTSALPPLPKGRGTKLCLVVGYRKRSNAVFSSVLSLCIYPPTANAVPPPLHKEGLGKSFEGGYGWLPCVKGAVAERLRDCFSVTLFFYNPSVTASRATSLYTREAWF